MFHYPRSFNFIVIRNHNKNLTKPNISTFFSFHFYVILGPINYLILIFFFIIGELIATSQKIKFQIWNLPDWPPNNSHTTNKSLAQKTS